MGWDEHIFGAIWRAFARARAPKRPLDHALRAASLASMKPRLAVIAAACAGRAVEIVAAEGVGGARGAVIALPDEIDFAPSRALNELVYVYRAVFDATSARLGFALSGSLPPPARALATLLAVRPTLDAIALDFEGIRRLHALLSAPLLAARPRAESPLEAIAQSLLGRAWADVAQELSAPSRAVAERALGARASDPRTLVAAVAALSPSIGAAPLPIVLWGELPASIGALPNEAPPGGAALGATGTERRGKPKDHIRRVDLGADDLDENPLVHSFEKLHTLDEHQGGKKRMDGADDLAEHTEALEELDLREIVRSRERAQSRLRVDAMIEGGAGDLADAELTGGVAYDEWDARSRAYKPGFCRVFVEVAKSAKALRAVESSLRDVRARHRGTARALREKFERIEHARAFRARQPDGADVDVDAIVDRHADLHAGSSGSDKLYVSRRPHAPSLSVFILVDASLSTDAWVEGRRVLDVAKESIVILGDVLAPMGGDLGVAAFHSNTRHDCRFVIVKRFSEPWARAHARLSALEPTGYTRIGPALRHATSLLEECQSRRKLLVLVSDGKPTDYDRYEGRHGIADVRQAVREASQKQVHTFGLAIERAATPYLAEMFGKGGYETLPRPDLLAFAMGNLVADLAA